VAQSHGFRSIIAGMHKTMPGISIFSSLIMLSNILTKCFVQAFDWLRSTACLLAGLICIDSTSQA
jgi:hypothetical protein